MPALELDENGMAAVWTFYDPNDKQRLLHTNPAKNLLAIGGGGSGKSFFLMGEAIYVCCQYAGANCLLLRRDYPELEKGLILDFKNTVPAECFDYNDTKHIVTFKNQSKLFFGHLQNQSERSLSQYLSSAFVFIGIDELGQFSYEAWSFLSWRNRVNQGCEPDVEGYLPTPRMAGATNPLGPGYGWIKSLWIDHKPVTQLGQTIKRHDGKFYQETHGKEVVVYDPGDYVYVHSTILDNPAQLRADPDYIRKLERLPPAMRQKALYGDLNAVAGAYFQNFAYDRHVLSLPRDAARIRWESWQPIWIGIDWGLAHHTTVYWFTRAQVQTLDSTPEQPKWKYVAVCYGEMVINETGYDVLCDMIAAATKGEGNAGTATKLKLDDEPKRLKHIFLSPDRYARTMGNTQHTIGLEMSNHLHSLGLPHCVPANNRRSDGAVFVYNLLESGDLMFIEEACPHIIRTMQMVVRDEKDLEDVLKSDSIEDDCWDGFRYGAVSMLMERGKPRELVEQEKIASIADPTARAIYAYQAYLKKQERAKPHKTRYAPHWMAKR